MKRGGPVPDALRRAVFLRDRGSCRVCGRRRWVDLHHIDEQQNGGEHSRENCLLLCTTCHSALHEGALRIEGNAEHDLRITDAKGNHYEKTTHIGSSPATTAEALTPAAQTILKHMGARGGWTAEALCNEIDLPVSQMMQAIFMLELDNHIKRRDLMFYERTQRPDSLT